MKIRYKPRLLLIYAVIGAVCAIAIELIPEGGEPKVPLRVEIYEHVFMFLFLISLVFALCFLLHLVVQALWLLAGMVMRKSGLLPANRCSSIGSDNGAIK